MSVTHFSEVILQDFQWVDSPATTEAEAQALYDVATDTYEAAQIVDISVGYKLNKNLQWLIGSNNLLNAYPTSQFDGWTDQGGLADSVQMGSDGRYIFSSLNFSFFKKKTLIDLKKIVILSQLFFYSSGCIKRCLPNSTSSVSS